VINFSAIFSHTFDNSTILSVPERFNAISRLNEAAARLYAFHKLHYPQLAPDTAWHWLKEGEAWQGNDPEEAWIANESLMLVGPGGLYMSFGRRACYVHAERLRAFVSVPEVQSATREICYALTSAMGGSAAIYLPDSGPWKVTLAFDCVGDDLTFEQIQGWLSQQIGPPADTIESMDAMLNNGDLGGYVIDHFEGLKRG
jgi:hypothetical protein